MAGNRTIIKEGIKVRVIEIDPTTKKVICEKTVLDNYVLQPNEIESLTGDIGQTQQPDGSFSDTPVSLDEIKSSKIKELQNDYYGSFTTFQSSATGTLKTYPIDETAQNNFMDLQNRLIADPNKNSFYFKTIEDGTLINHTRAQFLQLLEDGEQFKVNQTIHYDSLEQQVETAYKNNDQAGIESVTW